MLAYVLSLLPAQQGAEQQAPDQSTLAAWRDHIAPLATENRWREIAWQDSIAAGLRAATVAERPMLLWLMNGHPLGCT